MTRQVDTEILVIGAGPTGLGAALRCIQRQPLDFLVCERAAGVGGLATTHQDAEGFLWDIGGHIQFSHYRYFDGVMDWLLGDRWNEMVRESWIWISGRFVPYPFQNNLRYLSPDEAVECLSGLIEAHMNAPRTDPSNFAEWMDATFGGGITRLFMRPYNFKVWAHPATELDFGWIGERVAVPNWRRALENVLLERDDFAWGPNSTFRFPREGGTGGIWSELAGRLPQENLLLETELREIDLLRRRALLRSPDGDLTVDYRALINTIPLPEFLHLARPSIESTTSGTFRHSAVHVVGIGLDGEVPERLRTKCWMYFPEDDCPYFRATVFSNYSANNVPDPGGQWSLMLETSESDHRPIDSESLVDDCIAGAMRTGLLQASDSIVSRHHFRAEYGYPTPFLARDSLVDPLLAALRHHNVWSRGRFGAWKYEVSNQDHSLMQGVEAVDSILDDAPELTLTEPENVNAGEQAVNRLEFTPPVVRTPRGAT